MTDDDGVADHPRPPHEAGTAPQWSADPGRKPAARDPYASEDPYAPPPSWTPPHAAPPPPPAPHHTGPVPGAWGFPHPPGQPTVPPHAGTPHAQPSAFGPSYINPVHPVQPPYGGHPGFSYAAPVAEPREPVRWTWRIAAGLACIALAAGVIGGGIGSWVVQHDERSVTLRQPAASGPERPRDTVAGLAATTLPGVVYIHASKAGQKATGTGFVLDGSGYILTNNHVVANAADGGTIRVVFNGGEQTEARIVGRDTGYDLAVVKVDNVRGLQPLPLGNSDAVQVGDPVIAIGAPFNLAGTVTAGIISAKDRAVSAGGSGDDVSYISALQTDAPINPGNSGGPLIDAAGRVVGVNSAIRSAGEGGESGPFGTESAAGSIGLGFAIPINQAKRVAQQLIENGKAVHPVIGVRLDARYEGPGARVADQDDAQGRPPVRPGGPGDRAGLRPGDVVTALDGRKVADANELIVAVRSKAPGDTVTLTVQRDGAELSLPMTLEAENEGG